MANDTFLKDWVINGETNLASITRYLFKIKMKYGFFLPFLSLMKPVIIITPMDCCKKNQQGFPQR